MKPSSIITLTIAFISSYTSASAQLPADTVAIVEAPTVVRIIRSANGNKILIEGRESQPDYRLEYEITAGDSTLSDISESWIFNPPFAKKSQQSKQRLTTYTGSDIYAGAAIPMNEDCGFSRTGWEIGMFNVCRADWRWSSFGTSLSLGIGWQYRHFTIGDGMMTAGDINGKLSLIPIPADYHNVKSSLKVFSIQFPLTIRQTIYRSFTFEVGGVAMLNTYTSSSRSWCSGENESKTSFKNLHQRILTADILARIGWHGSFAFYARYTPMSQFKSQFGPDYDCLSIGASLGF